MGTYTTKLALYKPAVGETGWGALVNTDLDILDGLLTNPTITGTLSSGSETAVDWELVLTNPDSAGAFQFRRSVPASFSMTGGGAVQGCGLIFNGNSSAATPNAGLAETDPIRLAYTINSDAGQKLQVNLINGLLIASQDIGASGNESAVLLGTTRITGPAGSGTAMGAWGGDLHVEKAAGVRDGSMVGLEVGVHKAPALSSAKCRGFDLWSGDRSGITASRAGDALYLHGDRGWTNFLRCLHTDEISVVAVMDQNGNLTTTAPTGNATFLHQTNANTTSATMTIVGKTSGAVQVGAFIQANSGGQATIGSNSNHDLVFQANATEVFRVPVSGGLFKPIVGLESTGAGSAALGANSPASTLTAPYKWLKVLTSDGSTVYFPVWK